MGVKKAFFLIPGFLLCWWSIPAPAIADWINLSGAESAPNIAEIRIHDDHVEVDLEIFVNDLVTFDRLLPDTFFKGTDISRPPQAVRMQRFSKEDLQIITEKGRKLLARVKLIEPRMRKERPSLYAGRINPYTGQPIPGPPKDKRVVYAELVYPFRSKPESLTIIPPLDDDGRSKVSLGFITYHKGVSVVDFRYLQETSTVKLDWADPWYSEFDKKQMKRWWVSGVKSFLYIEPYEVRHEVLARVKDLAAWIDLGLRGKEFIEAEENEELKRRVGEFFLERDKVQIDGKRLRPILDRTALIMYSPTASIFLEQPERLPVNTAMVGVIITYLTGGMPQKVTNEWNLWSDRIRKVPTDAIDPAGGLPSYVTPDDNVHVWENFLKQYTIPTVEKIAVAESIRSYELPLGTVLCIGMLLPVAWQIRKRKLSAKSLRTQAGLAVLFLAGAVLLFPFLKVSIAKPGSLASRVTNEEGKTILHAILKNVYRAFDFREEGDVYDKLAVSVDGDLLADLYLQNRTSFRVRQAGGAVAKVKKIEVLDVKVQDNPRSNRALDLRSQWTAMGTVGHWGHIHNRRNEYEAIVTMEPAGGAWKITGLELLEERRIDPLRQQQDPAGVDRRPGRSGRKRK
ncbi:MAG: hypothetical protein WBB46_04815 [Candidatus Deferrimicrobiaceae bacterium]